MQPPYADEPDGQHAATTQFPAVRPIPGVTPTTTQHIPPVFEPERFVNHERYWTEARIVRIGASAAFVVCSIGLMIALGRTITIPWLGFLPWLVGTGAYGAIVSATWRSYLASEAEARRERERAKNSAIRIVGEPVDRDGRWS